MSNNEYEQQQFWIDEPIDIRIKYKHIYDIITYRIEEALYQTMLKQANKSHLPKGYTNEKQS